jgi:DNA (cytosine-5)-methyltransferase 1
MKPLKVLNLYAGLGGNRKLWEDVSVTSIENDPAIAGVYQELYPKDNLIIGDAHVFLKNYYKDFDFIWSSPPCQKHSKMMKATRHDVADYPDMRLYEEIIFLQHFYKGIWVVENVIPYYKPLIPPTIMIGRHCFWSNFKITSFEMDGILGFITNDNKKGVDKLKEWLGIHFEGNIYYGKNHSPGQVLRNCVHPKLGLHIFNCSQNIEVGFQGTLFE